MLCKICQYELDACCRRYLCCICAKKEYNKLQRGQESIFNPEVGSESSVQECDNYKVNYDCEDHKETCNEVEKSCCCSSRCGKCSGHNEVSITIRESITKSTTTGLTLIEKVKLPIVPDCGLETYLIEWCAEVSTTDGASGQIRVVVTLDVPATENMAATTEILSDVQLTPIKGTWIPYSSFDKVIVQKPSFVKLSFAALTANANTKNVCIRNAKITAMKIS